jgi:sigma-B regulation protein RsbU (phosphoserine phosphatase)
MDYLPMQTDLQNLKESNEFVNLLLDNINSVILIVDENLQIHQFNKSFHGLFDRATERVDDHSLGQMTGCVNAVEENKSCGATSQCQFCVLRKSFLQTFLEDFPVERKRLERVFYIEGVPVLKYLEFSSRLIQFHGRKMVLVIIYDITEIEQQKSELERRQTQINIDLEVAGEIQRSLLPHKSIEIKNTLTAWRFEPCHKVGGDIFQIYINSDEQISVYALDVSGHGVPAAFVALTISQFLQSLHNRMRQTGKLFAPETVMSRLEKEFPMERFDCFFSIVYATLNIRTGHLVYSNAGHMPPLILGSNGNLEILKHHGPVIGTGLDSPFGQKEQKLRQGDRFILYTDGLIENFGKNGECKGKNIFYKTLNELHWQPIKYMVDGVFDHSSTLRGETPPTDDMSLLAIEYKTWTQK